MGYKIGDIVWLQDGNQQRLAKVVKDGIDNKNRVRVRPEGYPIDLSITLEKNNRLYIIK